MITSVHVVATHTKIHRRHKVLITGKLLSDNPLVPEVPDIAAFTAVKGESHTQHAVPMPFPCHAVPLIHTCHAAPLPCSDNAVSFVNVRVVAGNIRTVSATV
jgi:hypothetical protein